MGTATKIYWRSCLNIADILEAIDSLPDNIQLPSDVYLEPPDVTSDTDADSGDEEISDPNRFNKNQLQAGVEVRFSHNDEDEIENEVEAAIPQINEVEATIPEIIQRQNFSQKWSPGNEDNLTLAAFMYQHARLSCKETKTCPLSFGEETEPIDFFQLFINKSFVEKVVCNTINYAAKEKNNTISFDVEDFYAFCGVLILSGYNALPRRRMYWEKEDDVRNKLVARWMRRNVFEDIFTNIHFCDNDTIKGTSDRFAKVRPLIIHLNEAFLKFAPIEMDISVDEAMVPYYGRHPCKQFIRNKPVRFGYKAWVAASRLGYCYQFDLYQGRNQMRDRTVGLGEFVVLSFANKMKAHFPEMYFSFYFDNFFTGPNLVNALRNIQFGGTGTLRESRLKNITMADKKVMNKNPRGYYENYVDKKNEIILTRWKDNQSVSLLSNSFGEDPVGAVRRYVNSQGQRANITQPCVVKMYNRNMGGVDLLDSHISNYRISIRDKKWYMPTVLWMVDLAVTNAWTLAKQYGCNVDQLEFRRRLAKALLIRHGKPPSKGKSMAKPNILSKGAHIAVKGEARLRCKQCHSHTIYKCSACNIALHANCFETFHNNLK